MDPRMLQVVFFPILIFASAFNAQFHILERRLGQVRLRLHASFSLWKSHEEAVQMLNLLYYFSITSKEYNLVVLSWPVETFSVYGVRMVKFLAVDLFETRRVFYHSVITIL